MKDSRAFTPPEDEQIAAQGIDALAWYCPLHTFGLSGWGIYFHRDRLRSYALKVQLALGEPSPVSVLRELRKKILHHERFHFLTEYLATIAEQYIGSDVFDR